VRFKKEVMTGSRRFGVKDRPADSTPCPGRMAPGSGERRSV